MTSERKNTGRPGDAMVCREIEAWYARQIRTARRDVEGYQRGDGYHLHESEQTARAYLAEYEAGYAQWREHGTMPWRHSETVSRVIGSIEGGLGAAFGPPVELSAGESAALEAGLDPALEPAGRLAPTLDAALAALGGEQREPNASMTAWENANRQYRARNRLGREAMGRMGLYRDGDPATPAMHAEFAADPIEQDAWRASVGLGPMWADAIREEQQAAGPEAGGGTGDVERCPRGLRSDGRLGR